MSEPTAAQMNCGHCLYGPPALCTCGTCTVEPPEGFIPFDGNECPCPGQPVDVMFRDGEISAACIQMPKADGWHWGRTGRATGEIVAYRIAEKTW